MNRKKEIRRCHHALKRAFPATVTKCPMMAVEGEHFVVYHELDGAGNIVRSIALGDGMFELISVAVAVLVLWAIIRFVMLD